jgi:hypothetical protein
MAIVDPTGSITVCVVLLGINYVPLDDTGGLVAVPDELATFDAAVLETGRGRAISGSSFLFLNSIHNTNRQH